ncbi:MAG: hypothetical protein U0S48_07515 [Solirubrobacteraceae bacterium]
MTTPAGQDSPPYAEASPSPIEAATPDARWCARTIRAGLGTIVAASAAPYGYTISIWSSGAVLLRSRGVPSVAEVFAFLAGALAGFAVMALAAHGAVTRSESLDHASDRVVAGALHWLAAGAAVGAAALLAEIRGWEAWPLASFAATTTYILGASVQLAAVSVRRAGGHRRR